MYLSIGNDMAVRQSSIIGIFDMDNTSTSRRTKLFLERTDISLPIFKYIKSAFQLFPFTDR